MKHIYFLNICGFVGIHGNPLVLKKSVDIF